eukprot:899733_1
MLPLPNATHTSVRTVQCNIACHIGANVSVNADTPFTYYLAYKYDTHRTGVPLKHFGNSICTEDTNTRIKTITLRFHGLNAMQLFHVYECTSGLLSLITDVQKDGLDINPIKLRFEKLKEIKKLRESRPILANKLWSYCQASVVDFRSKYNTHCCPFLSQQSQHTIQDSSTPNKEDFLSIHWTYFGKNSLLCCAPSRKFFSR